MNGQFELAPGPLGMSVVAGDNGERGHAGHRERFEVIVPYIDDDVRFAFVQNPAQLLHAFDAAIDFLGLLIGGTRKCIWRVRSSNSCNDFTHGYSYSSST